ncbi:universal stress protein [Nonomuraea purpurea]|uniref:Universal stress protein n=1 Tax=Nonomuraea purpurea TaxID=1849276 RepID=A0ABV8GTD1_9ACTN
MADASTPASDPAEPAATPADPPAGGSGWFGPGSCRPRNAELVVLGSRGQGGFEELRLGSAAVQVPAHSVKPVVIVGPDGESTSTGRPRIVVGADGSPAGQRALEFAFDEAELRVASVAAVCCWDRRASGTGPDRRGTGRDAAGAGRSWHRLGSRHSGRAEPAVARAPMRSNATPGGI